MDGASLPPTFETVIARQFGFLRAIVGTAVVVAGLPTFGCGSTEETRLALTVAETEAGFVVDSGDRSVARDAASGPDAASESDLASEVDASSEPDVASERGRDAEATGDRSTEAGPDRIGDRGAETSGGRCNGYEALCDRPFDEVVFPASHNAMSNADDGWPVANQTHPIARQLEDGIRAMLIDTYSYLGSSYLCHASCLLGSKKLVDALAEMLAFLRSNPNDVLTLIIEDHLSAGETEAAFVSSGLVDLVYTHPTGAPWPTLRTMIAQNHRVVVGAEMGKPPPDWYHHFYDLAWDTPYAFKTASDFSCQENRGTRANALFLLNHWLEDPFANEALSQTANAHDTLLGRARQCQRESGKLPNFVAVNHYSVGDLFRVVQELNGL